MKSQRFLVGPVSHLHSDNVVLIAVTAGALVRLTIDFSKNRENRVAHPR